MSALNTKKGAPRRVILSESRRTAGGKFGNILTAVFLLMLFNSIMSAQGISVTQNKSSLGTYGVYELTIAHDDAAYANVWEAADITCLFVNGTTGDTLEIYGFYYDRDTWKVRFAPPSEGSWTWHLSFDNGTAVRTDNGSFTCTGAERKGFLKRHPVNPYRIVYADGSLFDGIGPQNCTSNNMTFSHDSQGGYTVEQYAKLFGDAGANLYRFSIDNCGIRLFDTLDVDGNVYRITEGKSADRLVEALYANDLRLMLTFFGFTVEFGTCFWDRDGYWNEAQQVKLKHYLKYMVARYGAYADIWEEMNEHTGRSDWVKSVANYVRSIDPYKRMVTTSWEMAFFDEIDLGAPHLYCYWEPQKCDSAVVAMNSYGFRKQKSIAAKPVIYGEFGNYQHNWTEDSALRMRIQAWTAFFWEVMLIYWDTSYSKNYNAGAGNLYFGPDEMQVLKSLSGFTRNTHADVVMCTLAQGTAGIRSYGLKGGNHLLGYFTHYADHGTNANAVVDVDLPSGGEAIWYDPASGDTVSTVPVDSGSNRLTSPAFKIDCALKIVLDGAFSAIRRDAVTPAEAGYRIIREPAGLRIAGENISSLRIHNAAGITMGAAAGNSIDTKHLRPGIHFLEIRGTDGTGHLFKIFIMQ